MKFFNPSFVFIVNLENLQTNNVTYNYDTVVMSDVTTPKAAFAIPIKTIQFPLTSK